MIFFIDQRYSTDGRCWAYILLNVVQSLSLQMVPSSLWGMSLEHNQRWPKTNKMKRTTLGNNFNFSFYLWVSYNSLKEKILSYTFLKKKKAYYVVSTVTSWKCRFIFSYFTFSYSTYEKTTNNILRQVLGVRKCVPTFYLVNINT